MNEELVATVCYCAFSLNSMLLQVFTVSSFDECYFVIENKCIYAPIELQLNDG